LEAFDVGIGIPQRLTTLDTKDVCITPRAVLGFHSAFIEGPDGSEVFARNGTIAMWHEYPKAIRAMIKAKGWDGVTAHPDILWIDHDELPAIYPDCTPHQLAQNW
jgi:hypothetical protein